MRRLLIIPCFIIISACTPSGGGGEKQDDSGATIEGQELATRISSSSGSSSSAVSSSFQTFQAADNSVYIQESTSELGLSCDEWMVKQGVDIHATEFKTTKSQMHGFCLYVKDNGQSCMEMERNTKHPDLKPVSDCDGFETVAINTPTPSKSTVRWQYATTYLGSGNRTGKANQTCDSFYNEKNVDTSISAVRMSRQGKYLDSQDGALFKPEDEKGYPSYMHYPNSCLYQIYDSNNNYVSCVQGSKNTLPTSAFLNPGEYYRPAASCWVKYNFSFFNTYPKNQHNRALLDKAHQQIDQSRTPQVIMWHFAILSSRAGALPKKVLEGSNYNEPIKAHIPVEEVLPVVGYQVSEPDTTCADKFNATNLDSNLFRVFRNDLQTAGKCLYKKVDYSTARVSCQIGKWNENPISGSVPTNHCIDDSGDKFVTNFMIPYTPYETLDKYNGFYRRLHGNTADFFDIKKAQARQNGIYDYLEFPQLTAGQLRKYIKLRIMGYKGLAVRAELKEQAVNFCINRFSGDAIDDSYFHLVPVIQSCAKSLVENSTTGRNQLEEELRLREKNDATIEYINTRFAEMITRRQVRLGSSPNASFDTLFNQKLQTMANRLGVAAQISNSEKELIKNVYITAATLRFSKFTNILDTYIKMALMKNNQINASKATVDRGDFMNLISVIHGFDFDNANNSFINGLTSDILIRNQQVSVNNLLELIRSENMVKDGFTKGTQSFSRSRFINETNTLPGTQTGAMFERHAHICKINVILTNKSNFQYKDADNEYLLVEQRDLGRNECDSLVDSVRKKVFAKASHKYAKIEYTWRLGLGHQDSFYIDKNYELMKTFNTLALTLISSNNHSIVALDLTTQGNGNPKGKLFEKGKDRVWSLSGVGKQEEYLTLR